MINLENLAPNEDDNEDIDRDVTEFEIEPYIESPTEILKRARKLIKPINDGIKHLKKEVDDLMSEYGNNSRSNEEIDADLKKDIEERKRLTMEIERLKEEARQQIAKNKKSRENK